MYSNVKSVSKKVLAILLSVVMLLSVMPLSVLAQTLKEYTAENETYDFVLSAFDGTDPLEELVDGAVLTITEKASETQVFIQNAEENHTISITAASVAAYLTADYEWKISAPTFEDYVVDSSTLSYDPLAVSMQATYYQVSAAAGNTETVNTPSRVRAGGELKFTIQQTTQKDLEKQYVSTFCYQMGETIVDVKPGEEVTIPNVTGDVAITAIIEENDIGITFGVTAQTWTNANEVTVSSTVAGYTLYYSTSADGSNKKEVPITLSDEGSNTFYVWGEKANTKSDVLTYTVFYDHSVPVVGEPSFKTEDDKAYTTAQWTNQNVTVSVAASDANSGLAKVELLKQDDTLVQELSASEGTYTYTFEVAEGSVLNETYYIKATDNVTLNTSTQAFQVMIDKSNPVIDSVVYKAGDESYTGAWVNKDVELSATVSDTGSDIAKIELFDSEDNLVQELAATEGKYNYTFAVEDGKALEKAYYVKVTDNIGNATDNKAQAQDVKVDKILPTVSSVTVSKEGTDTASKILNVLTFGIFFNPSVKVTVDAQDANSGINNYELVLSDGSTTKTYPSDTNEFVVNEDTAKTDFGIEDLTSDAFKFSIQVNVADQAGNVMQVKPDTAGFEDSAVAKEFMLEQVKPALDITVNEEAYAPTDAKWYADKAAIAIHATDSDSGLFKVELVDHNNGDLLTTYKYGAAEPAEETGDKTININTADLKFNTETGSYSFTVTVTDNCGNQESKSYIIKKDINAPQITNVEFAAVEDETQKGQKDDALSYEPAVIKNDKNQYGYFFDRAAKVTFFVSDSMFDEASSGIQDVVVNLVDFEGNVTVPTLNKTDLSKVSFTVDAGFKGYIFAYATDAVGNSTVKGNAPADISFEGKQGTAYTGADASLEKRNAYNNTEGATNWVSAEYAQKVQLSEATAKFAAYNGWVSAFGLIAESADQHEAAEQTVTPAAEGWTIVAHDAANHIVLYRQNATFEHEKTEPKNTTFYNNDVQMKVVISDTFNGIRSAEVNFTPEKFNTHNVSFDINAVALADRTAGTELANGIKIEAVDENLVTVISKEFTIAKTEEYTYIGFAANMKDMSLNESSISDQFSVDSEDPTFDIKVNGEDYAPTDEKWYADNVDVNIIANDTQKANQSGIYTVEVFDLNDGGKLVEGCEYQYGKKTIGSLPYDAQNLAQETSNVFNTALLKFDTASSLYNFRIKVTDNSNNSIEKTYTIKKDINAPQITDIEFAYIGIDKNLENAEYTPEIIRNKGNDYGFFIQQATTVTLKVSDALLQEDFSGISDVVVKVLDLSGNSIDIENLDKSNLNAVTFDLAAGFKGYIYAYAVDTVGNSTVKDNNLATDLSYQGKEGTSYVGTDDSHYARNAYNDAATKAAAADHAINWISSDYAARLRLTENPNYAGYVSAYGIIAETKDQHEAAEQTVTPAAEGWTIVAHDAANHVVLYRQNNPTFEHEKTNPKNTTFYNNDVKMKVVISDTFNGIRSAEVNFTPDKFNTHNVSFDINAVALADRTAGTELTNGIKIEAVDENLVTVISKEFTVEKSEEFTYIGVAAKMEDMSLNASSITDQFSVDSTKPAFDIKVNGKDYAPTDEKWYADNVDVNIIANDGTAETQSGLYTVQVFDLNDLDESSKPKLAKEYTYGKQGIDTLIYDSSDTFNTADLKFDVSSSLYNFKVVVIDNCGNTIDKTYIIKKDINAPQITDIEFAYIGIDKNLENAEYTPEIIRNEGNDYGFFIQQATTVTLKVSDALLQEDCSGISDVVVKVLDLSGNSIDIENLDKSNLNAVTFDLAAGFKGYIYAYAVDTVGNSTVKDNNLATDLSYQGKEGTSYVGTDDSHYARNAYNDAATKAVAADHAINWISSDYAARLRLTENPNYAGFVSAYGIIAETKEQHDTSVQTIADELVSGWTLVKTDTVKDGETTKDIKHIALYRKNASFNHAQTDPDTLFYNEAVQMKVVISDTFNGIRSAEVNFTPEKFNTHNVSFDINAIALADRTAGTELANGIKIEAVDENLVTVISKEFTVEKSEEFTYIGVAANMVDMSLNTSSITDQFSVDSTAPAFDIKVNGEDYAPTDEKWYADNVDVNIIANDGTAETQSGLYTVQVFDLNDLDEGNNPKLAKEYTYGKQGIDTLIYDSSDTFNTADLKFDAQKSLYNFKVVVYDNCGNTIDKTYIIKKDINAPQITNVEFAAVEDETQKGQKDDALSYEPAVIKNDKNQYGYFFDRAAKVTFFVSDSMFDEASSGVASVVVKLVDVKGNVTTPELTSAADFSTVSFEVAAGFKGYIFAYATDAVGNSTVKGNAAADISFEGKQGTAYTGADASLEKRNAYNNTEGATNWVSAAYAQKVQLSEATAKFAAYDGWVSAFGLIAESADQHESAVQNIPAADKGWTIVAHDDANHVALYRKNAPFNHAQTDPDTLFYNEAVQMKVVVTDRFNGIRSAEVKFTNCTGHDAEFSVDDATLTARENKEPVDGWNIDETDENLVIQISKEFTIAKTEEYTYIGFAANMKDMSLNESSISDQFSVDSTNPAFDIKVNGEDDVYAPVDAFKWYADNVDVNIIANDGTAETQSGLYTVQVFDLNDLDKNKNPKLAKEYTYGKQGIDTLIYDSSDTFNTADLKFDAQKSLYNFKVVVYDNCGNTIEKTYIIKKDINAPQITDITFNPVQIGVDERLKDDASGGYDVTTKENKKGEKQEVYTPKIIRNADDSYGFFFDVATQVKLNISDSLLGEDNSGIADVIVKVVGFDGIEVPQEKLNIVKSANKTAVTFEIAAGFKGYIYAYAVDTVGNSTVKEDSIAGDLSFENDTYKDTDIHDAVKASEGVQARAAVDAKTAHLNRSNYNGDAEYRAVNWISADYASRIRKTEDSNYAGYVSAYGMIVESQGEHNIAKQEVPAPVSGWKVAQADAMQHIVIQRGETDYHNLHGAYGDLYDKNVKIKIYVTDAVNGIRNANIKFGDAVDISAAGFKKFEKSFDIQDVELNGSNNSGWKIESTDHNLVTCISTTILIPANKDYETNGINFTVSMTDMGWNTTEIYDEFSIDITKPQITITDLNSITNNNGTGDPGFYKDARRIRVAVKDANFYPNLTPKSESNKRSHFESAFDYELLHKGYNDADFATFKKITQSQYAWSVDQSITSKENSKQTVHYFVFSTVNKNGNAFDGEYLLKNCFAQDAAKHNTPYKPANTSVKYVMHFFVDTQKPILNMKLITGTGTFASNNVDGIDYFKTAQLQYQIYLNDSQSAEGSTSLNYATYFKKDAFSYTVKGASEAKVVNSIANNSTVTTETYSQDSMGNYDSFVYMMKYTDKAGNPATYTYTSGGQNDFSAQTAFKETKVCPDSVQPVITVTPADGTHGKKNENFNSSFTATDKNLSQVTHKVEAVVGYKDNAAKSLEVNVTDNAKNAAAANATVTQTVLKTLVDKNGKYDGVYNYTVTADDRATNVANENKGSYIINGRGSSYFIDTKSFIDIYNGGCVQEVSDNLVFTEYTLCDKPSTVWAVVNGQKLPIPTQYLDRRVIENINGFNVVSWTIDADWFNKTFIKPGEFIELDIQIFLQDAEKPVGNITCLIDSVVDLVDKDSKQPVMHNTDNSLVLSFALDNENPEIAVIDSNDANQYNAGLSGLTGKLDIEKTKDNEEVRELKIKLTDKSIRYLGYKAGLDSSDDKVVENVKKELMQLLPKHSKVVLDGKDYDAKPQVSMETDDEVIYTFSFIDSSEEYLVTIDAKDKAGNSNYLGNDDSTPEKHDSRLIVSSSFFVRIFVDIRNFVTKNTVLTIVIGAVLLAAIAAAIIIPVLRKRDEDPDEVEE